MLCATVGLYCFLKLSAKNKQHCTTGEALFAILRKINREATQPHKPIAKLLHNLFCPTAPRIQSYLYSQSYHLIYFSLNGS